MTELNGLYAIADAGSIAPEGLMAKAEQALSGGARLVQYRNKHADAESKLRQARELAVLCRSYKVPLIVNDDPLLARAAGAQGVHLGRDDMDIAQARGMLGPEAIIGVSCYNNPVFARAAERAGADYVAFGSFFASPTKPDAVRAEINLLKEARRELTVPICAIGGITIEIASLLIEAGADMIAVASGLFAQPNIKATAQRFASLFRNHFRSIPHSPCGRVQ